LSAQPAEADVAAGLLAHLRATLGEPGLTYAEPPVRVIGGFDTLIYSFRLKTAAEGWSGPLILRVFRRHADPLRARWESAVQTALVQMGYPAPRVALVGTTTEVVGGAFVIMERLPGKMMLEDVFKPARLFSALPRILSEVPRVVAEAQVRLHALDPGPLLRALEAEGLPAQSVGPAGVSQRMATVDGQLDQVQRRIEGAALDGLKTGLQWLLEHRPPEPEERVICHGDFHPLNILMEGETVSGVIDWVNTTVADPAYDVGNTNVLLRLAPLEFPLVLELIGAVARPILARRYYAAYRRLRSVNPEAMKYYEALRCVVELAWVGERRLADAGVIEPRSGPNPWGAPPATNRLVSHFREITGVTLTLPAVPSPP
jgi:aminoglycoside phosphotransferase (APT) family kinase protein